MEALCEERAKEKRVGLEESVKYTGTQNTKLINTHKRVHKHINMGRLLNE